MIFFRISCLLFFVALGFLSCKKTIDPTPVVEKKDSVVVVKIKEKFFDENTWIYSQMKKNYLWESKMPEEIKTDKNLEPIAYYKSLIYSEKDWFSYMKTNKDDVLNFWGGTPYAFGFRYKTYAPDPSKDVIFMAIGHVPAFSPAQKAGLQRGDIIEKINGADVTLRNLGNLLNQNNLEITWRNISNTLQTAKLSKSSYPVRPVDIVKVFELEKKKIGYLAFTQFLSNIDEELRGVFGNLKNQKIDEFILDLRFNPGGFTPNAEVVGSLMAKNLNPNEKMFGGVLNAFQTDLEKKRNPGIDGRKWTNEPNNIGNLNRVFILTSKTTSSSSELVINCLRTKMDVILIGDNTFGKAVISTILVDSTNKFSFSIMPAFSTLENSKGEAPYAQKDGFVPNFKVEDSILPYFPIGDTHETLLRRTLEIITGKKIEDKPGVKLFSVKFTDDYHHYDSHAPFSSN